MYETQSLDRSAADLITAVDGQAIHKVDDFLEVIEDKKPGDVVELSLIRNRQPLRVQVRLGSRGE